MKQQEAKPAEAAPKAEGADAAKKNRRRPNNRNRRRKPAGEKAE
jgi:hypothetical protein